MLLSEILSKRYPSKIRQRLPYEISSTILTYATEAIKPFNSIPRPFQLPFLGNWYLYKQGYYNSLKYQEVLQWLYEKYGPVVYEKIGLHAPVIHIFEVKDVETIYKNESKTPKIFPLSKFLEIYRKKERVCPGLGQTNGDEWYRLRSGVRDVMMKTQNLKQYIPTIETVTNDLVGTICSIRNNAEEIENLYYQFGQWSIEVAGEIVMGKKLGYLNGPNVNFAKKIIDANDIIFELGSTLKFSLSLYKYFYVPNYSKLVENEKFIHSFFYNLIDEVITKIKEKQDLGYHQNTGRRLFLEEILKQPNLSRDEVIILTLSLFVDPLSTVVPVLISSLFALATNKDVQNKAYEEICKVTNNLDVVSSETLNELTYLKAIIKETFRMYPNGVEIARISETPLVLSNYEIPPGTHLSMNLLVHYRSEKYFSKPNAFKPERWIKNSGETASVDSYLLLPFGIRARTCTGRRFAELYLYMSLCKIIKAFHLSYPADGPDINFFFKNLLFPDKCLPIRFKLRK